MADMRYGFAALSLFALAAFAQPPAEEPETRESKSGLSGLSEALDDLDDMPATEAEVAAEDESAPAETPAEPEATVTDAEAPPETSVAETPSAGTGSEATGTPAIPQPLGEAEIGQLEEAAARGRQLFAIARAGLLATQDMLSRVADPDGAGISGWVAEPEGNAMSVTFYADGEEGAEAVYRARILGGRAVSRETFLTGDRPALSGLAKRLAIARDVSDSDDRRACTSQPFNVLAIPPSTPEAPVLVYRISAPEGRSRIPLGGHYRSTVAADGEVLESRAYSHGCLNVELAEVPAGAQAGPIALTHLLDPLPTEVHVFLSLVSGRPLVVAAGDPTRLFMVAGDAVREIRSQSRP